MRQIGVETDHPLKRIQEEINEVAKRERELRQRDHNENNSNNNTNNQDDNSDDSGFSMCSSPVHNSITNGAVKQQQTEEVNQQNKILSDNNYSEPQLKILTRARSTPQLFQKSSSSNRFNGSSNTRGIMQKFIASRGKISNTTIKSSTNNYMQIETARSAIYIPPMAISSPPIIERDSNGRPIRPGYIPVEEKIQKELKDLKSREVELKRIRKVRNQSHSESLDKKYDIFDSGEASAEDEEDIDNNYPTTALAGKLRSAKSIGELCDALNNSSQHLRDTPSPQFERRRLRPALSLAQLCDLDPTEAPSSHKLIEKFENLISKKQEVS